MVSKCNICGELNCTWVLPDDYAPSINIRNYKEDEVLTVFSNCMVLIKNQIFDVKDDKLVGYSRINLSQSLKYGFQKLFHRQAFVERNQAVVLKIKETLNYILQINSGRPETVMGYPLITEDYEGQLNNLTFYPGGCIFYTYEDLAKKIHKFYPKDQYPELYVLVNRILHERKHLIEIDSYEIQPDGSQIWKGRKEVQNRRMNVLRTPYEKITLW